MKLPHLHTFTRDNNTRSRPRRLLDRTFHLWVRRHAGDERTLLDAGGQIIAGRLDKNVSLRLHFGGMHSETPIDTHISLFGQALYLNTSRGRHLAQALTKGKGRDLALRLDDGRLSYTLWANPDESRRASRRHGVIVVSLLDRLYGRKRFWYRDLDAQLVELTLPEGKYPVDLTLQMQTHGRPKLRRRTEQLVVDWNAVQGIPTHHDHSGGWKGDRTYGSAVSLTRRRDDWPIDATAALAAWVMNERVRTGFRTAQEEIA